MRVAYWIDNDFRNWRYIAISLIEVGLAVERAPKFISTPVQRR